jgi:predicted HAD superfamily Cof-like phosphohydrolase
MIQDWVDDVIKFHEKFVPDQIGSVPAWNHETLEKRTPLLVEEFQEMLRAVLDDDFPGYIDSIVDAIYLMIGDAVACGVDLRPIWDAVHRANMAKEKDGNKPIKPPGWTPPDVAGLLRGEASLACVDCQ